MLAARAWPGTISPLELISVFTEAFARESGVALPGTGLVSQLMARVYGLEDAARR